MLVYSNSMPITDARIVKLYKKLLELTGLFSQVLYDICIEHTSTYLYHCALLVRPLYRYCKHEERGGEKLTCMPTLFFSCGLHSKRPLLSVLVLVNGPHCAVILVQFDPYKALV